MNKVIKVENLSKQYRLGNIGTGTLTHDINRWWHRVRGKEDPYLKIGERNDRSKKGDSDYVWALQNINFDVKQGEVLGIIGRNGAGKSTLLKMLSRTTGPTTGSIKIKGRVASLLEVGTGFHPELTGRENIFLNGAILGMTKSEIKRKFDEIVDFSGVERYIDTPVKRYSSGMYVRLAFAVAAHLEPEILIVDEVLAVGDAEFQNKCLGKMKDVSTNNGRTVLFVSHQMNAIETLCDTTLFLDKGGVNSIGVTKTIIANYLKNNVSINNIWVNNTDKFNFPEFKPMRFSTVNSKYVEVSSFSNDQPIGICIEGVCNKITTGFCLGFALYDADGRLLFWSYNTDKKYEDWVNVNLMNNKIVAWIPPHLLNEGEYRAELISSIHFKEWQCEPDKNPPTISFAIKGGLSESPQWIEARPGILGPILSYTRVM